MAPERGRPFPPTLGLEREPVAITFLYDEDKVNTEIGDKLTIQDAGDVNISSKGGADVQTFNAAAAVATSYNSKVAVGGALNVLILKNI